MLQSKHSKKNGQSLVEFALTIPILLFVMTGIVDLGRAMFAYSQLIDATRQAVRYGITTGLDDFDPQYLDYEEIIDNAMQLPGVYNLRDAAIEVTYTDTDGNLILSVKRYKQVNDDKSESIMLDFTNPDGSALGTCAQGGSCPDTTFILDIDHGFELAVTVTGELRALTPFLTNLFAITFEHTSRRTIMTESTPFTDEWVSPPEAPASFEGPETTVSCTVDSSTSVFTAYATFDFTWTGVIGADSAMIIEAQTNETVANIEPIAEDGSLTVVNAPLKADSSSENKITKYRGVFYMITTNESNSYAAHGPSSDIVVVVCPTDNVIEGEVTVPTSTTIDGSVWVDTDGDGVKDTGEPGLEGMEVTLTHTTDLTKTYTSSTTNSSGVFSAFTVTDMLAGQYSLSVDNPGVSGYTYTITTANPVTITTDASNTLSIGVQYSTAPPPSDPVLTTISGFVWDEEVKSSDNDLTTYESNKDAIAVNVTVILTRNGTDYPYADVFVSGSNITDGNGNFEFTVKDIPSGQYTVSVNNTDGTSFGTVMSANPVSITGGTNKNLQISVDH